MARNAKIVELMKVPAAQHDLYWVKESLQAAIQLEFTTIPPYLCAPWSVKDDKDLVAGSIRTKDPKHHPKIPQTTSRSFHDFWCEIKESVQWSFTTPARVAPT
jgi:hypothetical protein